MNFAFTFGGHKNKRFPYRQNGWLHKMKQYWVCPYFKCTHKNEETSHLVPTLPHEHNGETYQLQPYKKERKPSSQIKKLKEEVWALFSEWVRRSEANNQGYCKCVSCGAIKHWKDGDAGHYIHGTGFLIPELVHFQCKICNSGKHGNLIGYRAYMIQRYGEPMFDRLTFLAKRPHVYTVFELQKYKIFYTQKLEPLREKF